MSRVSLFVLLIVAVFTPTATMAQAVAGLGGVTGTVRDASGSVVPGAMVTVTNDSKGIRRTLETTEAGLFAAPALVPAPGYSVTVSKQGFSEWAVRDFQVQVGETPPPRWRSLLKQSWWRTPRAAWPIW